MIQCKNLIVLVHTINDDGDGIRFSFPPAVCIKLENIRLPVCIIMAISIEYLLAYIIGSFVYVGLYIL